MAILTKRELIWYASMGSALLGLLIALSMFLIDVPLVRRLLHFG